MATSIGSVKPLNRIKRIARRPLFATARLASRQAGNQSLSAMACKHQLKMRPYDHAVDHAEVAEICRHVYDGGDYLPREVERIAATHTVLVAEAVDGGRMDGLVCTEVRGSVLWVFGARVRDSSSGRGVATQLMEASIELAREHGLKAVVSVTILDNLPMRRVFQRCGLEQQASVDVWPSRHAQRRASASGDGLSALADLVRSSPSAVQAPEARLLLPLWRRCASLAELHAATESLQSSSSSSSSSNGGDASSGDASGGTSSSGNAISGFAGAAEARHVLPDWLPHVYMVCPLDWHQVEAWVQEGNVWLLPDSSSSSGNDSWVERDATAQGNATGAERGQSRRSDGTLAIMLLAPSPELQGTMAAGIRGATAAAIESALLHAHAFAGGDFRGFIHPSGEQQQPSAFYDATGGVSDFGVYSREVV